MDYPTATTPRPRRLDVSNQDNLLLSAILIELEQERFEASVLPYVSDQAFDELRTREQVFAYRRQNEPPATQLLAIPIVDEPVAELPEPISFVCKQQLRFLAALLERRLPDLFPKLGLRRAFFGLDRVRMVDDLMDLAFQRASVARPKMLEVLHKHHRTRFHVRHEFMPGRGSFLALTVEFRREFSIDGTAADLLLRGLCLEGLALLAVDDAQRWMGRVLGLEAGQLIVAGEHGETRLDPHMCRVEPNSESFSRLIPQALGGRELEHYEAAEHAIQTEQLSGDGYLTRLSDVANYFSRAGSLRVARGISICFDKLLSTPFGGPDPAAVLLPPVEYCFSADRTAIDTMPFRGLDLHGPFDGRRFQKKEPRLLVVCPASSRAEADIFIRRLLEGMAKDGKDRFARGLAATYRLTKVTPQFLAVELPRPGSSDVGNRYVRALAEAFDPLRRPDIVFVIVRDEDAFIEVGNPYVASKAYLLSQGLPSQEVRLSKIRSAPGNLQYILEDIAVATYAKLGGSPWTLMSALPLTKEIVLGMAYAEFGGRFASRQRYMGITTVFTSDGTYVLAAKSPRCRYEEYPAALATTVKDTLARLITEYGWGEGDIVRLVFHSSKPLTRHDVSTVARTAVQELGAGVQFEAAFLTILKDHPFKVLAPAQRGRKGVVETSPGRFGYALVGQCVPERGVVVNLGRAKRLVCVHGSSLVVREGSGIPQPLLVTLDPASTYTDMSALARQVYQLTGLSWGSMKPVAEPVTIHYARLISKMLSRLDGHSHWNDGLLDTHLRTSRWFL